MSLFDRMKVEVVCVGVPEWDLVLWLDACGEPVFEGCIEVSAIVCEEVAESAGQELPVPHVNFTFVFNFWALDVQVIL